MSYYKHVSLRTLHDGILVVVESSFLLSFKEFIMKVFAFFSACNAYRLYQNVNLETGQNDWEMETRQEEFNRVFKSQSRSYDLKLRL